jgi:hypothetical protein
MRPRSIDEVWRQMQVEKQLQEQRRFEQERKMWEQRERQRQEYLLSIKMNEKLAPTVPTSAAASAGGTVQTIQDQDFPTLFGETHMITWADVSTDTWKYIVHNFNTGELSEIFDTELIYDSGNEWYLYDEWLAVSEKGHSVVFRKSGTNLYKIYFFNVNGELVGQKDLESRKDFQYTENAQIYVGDLNGLGTVYHFDGDNVRTHTFEGLSASSIEVDDFGEDDVTKDGSVIIEAPDNSKRFISRPSGELVEITSDIQGANQVLLDYNTDFLFAVDQDLWVKSISQGGELKNTMDLSPYNIENWNEISLYGDNCAYVLLTSYDSYRMLVSYDGDSNQFVSITFSDSLIYDISYHERSWQSPRPYFGKTLILTTYQSRADNYISGFEGSGVEISWLLKSADEFQSYMFSGTVSFFESGGNWVGDRTFAIGENPMVMFAYTQSVIQAGFLLSSGFFTQSTGVTLSLCSNIWGKPIGDHSFAVFDVLDDRVWQVYDQNSIVSQTSSSSAWSWGTSNWDVNRYGTLLVLGGGGNNFAYTTEIGLTSAPSDINIIYNNVNWGDRTGISTEYQIGVRYIPGQEGNAYVAGFYVLSRSGFSSYEEFPFTGLSPSIPHTISGIEIGTEIVSFNLINQDNSNLRCIVYDLSTLGLIDDYDTEQSTDVYIQSWKNRVAVIKQNANERQIKFIGKHGIQTKKVDANSFSDESNDPRDNDD